MTTPIIKSHDQREVLRRFAGGEEILGIVEATGLSKDFVDGLIMHTVTFDRRRAGAAVRAYDEKMATSNGRRTAEQAADPSPIEVVVERRTAPTLEQLLVDAETSGTVKAKRLAAHIRVKLDELRTEMAASAKERQIMATIAALRKHMDQAYEELRTLKNGTPAKAPVGFGKGENAAIRAWAAEQGFPCKMGKIPQRIREAYAQANEGKP